jgi:EspG family
MTENQWRLDGLTFTIALETLGRDRLPYPLRYLPEGVEALDDYERMRIRAAQNLQRMIGPDLYDAFTTLLEPQVRVEVHGYYGPNFTGAVRMHAGVANHKSTLALQLPGRTPEYGSDVIIVHGVANSLPTQIATSLPKCKPGQHPSIKARRSDLQAPEYSRNPLYLSHTEKLNRIIRRPRSSIGEISVHPGPATDSRPTDDGRSIHWMDYLPTDGRYLLHHHSGNEFTLTPASPEDIARTIHALIATTQRTLTTPW